MKAARFDAFTRHLTIARSRRTLVAFLLGGLLALPGHSPLQVGTAAKRCKKINDKRQRRRCRKKARTRVPVLLYQCPGSSEPFFDVPATTRVAQTFTAAQSGALHQIQLQIEKPAGSAGSFVVQLLAVAGDTPTNTVLAQTTVANKSVPAGISMLTARFSGPSLVAGTPYAAALGRPGGASWRVGTRSGNVCTGSAFTQSPSGDGTFTLLGSGIDVVSSFFAFPGFQGSVEAAERINPE